MPRLRAANVLDLAYVLMALALYLGSWWLAKKLGKR
jgi:hypothetical protein